MIEKDKNEENPQGKKKVSRKREKKNEEHGNEERYDRLI